MLGGYRAGAGRKQGFAAKKAEEARKLLSERVAHEIGLYAMCLFHRQKRALFILYIQNRKEKSGRLKPL